MNRKGTIDSSFSPIKTGSEFEVKIIEDSMKYLWIAKFDKGVFCYQNDKLIKWSDIKNAMSICQDNESNIWIASSMDGLYQIIPYYFYSTFFTCNESDGGKITALARYKGNDLTVLLRNGR